MLVLAFLPFLVQSLEVHSDVYIGMEEMKNTLILQQHVHEAIYEIENGFRLAVEDGLRSVSVMYMLDPTGTTEKIARETVCLVFVEPWKLKHSEYEFTFNCLLDLHVNIYEASAWLSSDFIAEKKIHNAKVTVKIPMGRKFRA